MARTVRLSEERWRLVLRAVEEILNTEADGPPYMTAIEVAELMEAEALINAAPFEDD